MWARCKTKAPSALFTISLMQFQITAFAISLLLGPTMSLFKISQDDFLWYYAPRYIICISVFTQSVQLFTQSLYVEAEIGLFVEIVLSLEQKTLAGWENCCNILCTCLHLRLVTYSLCMQTFNQFLFLCFSFLDYFPQHLCLIL